MNTFLIIGHSHINCLNVTSTQETRPNKANYEFVHMRFKLHYGNGSRRRGDGSGNELVDVYQTASVGKRGVILCPGGNQHNVCSLVKCDPAVSSEELKTLMERVTNRHLANAMQLIQQGPAIALFILPVPPPVEDADWIRQHPSVFAEKLANSDINDSDIRLAAYHFQIAATRQFAARHNIDCLTLPDSVFSANGFLAEDCRYEADPTHGNALYGQRVLAHIDAYLASLPESAFAAARAVATYTALDKKGARAAKAEHREEYSRQSDVEQRRHPYMAMPDYAFWNKTVGRAKPGTLDPVTNPLFQITPQDRVATAGSCFAQHISKRLKASGFNYLVTEETPPDVELDPNESYDFSARYGNIYTARQLLQLFDMAFGYFTPVQQAWPLHTGGFCDPFRPRIQPGGFASVSDVIKARRKHLMAVRKMFKRLDVFVFTLGLTESFESVLDGAVYPMAPGVVGGNFDPASYRFVNFTVDDVVHDMQTFINKLRLVNKKARVLLTVSPVPLMATAEDRHVLLSTTYSKAVLRVAAEQVCRSNPGTCYFPSYEIITGPQSEGAYYGEDKRSITEKGVDHVMRVFMSRMTTGAAGVGDAPSEPMADVIDARFAEMERLAQAACDEDFLAR